MDDALDMHFSRSFHGGPEIVINLCIPAAPAGVTILFGPSGSGKTTLLRGLAGLDRNASGRIRLGAEPWLDSSLGINLSPQQRKTGFLFQDYALFPHLSVEGNIRYGLRGLPRSEAALRVGELMERFQLAGLADRFPHHLSGGQKQRVALARAVGHEPRLLLMDEPLSALDAPTREALRGELRSILQSLGIPVLLVTHDRIEALALGDHLAVIDGGRVLQYGPVDEVFRQPANESVARIVGVETVLAGRVVSVEEGMATVDARAIHLTAPVSANTRWDQAGVYVCIRAEDVILIKGEGLPKASPRNRLPGKVTSLTREGAMVRIALDCGIPLAALLTRQACDELALREGDLVTALVKAPNVHLIPRSL